eukprot:1686716-Amphidinium_carterae.1
MNLSTGFKLDDKSWRADLRAAFGALLRASEGAQTVHIADIRCVTTKVPVAAHEQKSSGHGKIGQCGVLTCRSIAVVFQRLLFDAPSCSSSAVMLAHSVEVRLFGGSYGAAPSCRPH